MRTPGITITALALLLFLSGCGQGSPPEDTGGANPGDVSLPAFGAENLDRYLAAAAAIRAAGAEFDTSNAADPERVRAQMTALTYREEYAGALADADLSWDGWFSLHRIAITGLGAVASDGLKAKRLEELEAQRANLTPEQYEAMRAGLEKSGGTFATVPEEIRDLIRARQADIEAAWK